MTKSEQLAASVHQRLKNLTGTNDFQTTLVLYALERLLYRLSQSAYRQQFVLKGALLFNIWLEHSYRSTRNADFLSFGDSTPERIEEIFRELCVLDVEADGLEFVTDSVVSSRIKYDLWVLATDCSFDGTVLGEALTATFARRKSLLPQTVADVVALTPLFAADAQKQQAWRAFLRKHQSLAKPLLGTRRFANGTRIATELSLMEVVEIIQEFLLPVSAIASSGEVFSGRWVGGQRGWQIAP